MLAVASISGSVVAATPAYAHDSILSSDPASGARIPALPKEITLEFSGEPQEGFNTLALSREGKVVLSGTPRAQGRRLTLDVPSTLQADPGTYTIGYQITSSDGHATRGSFDFTITGSAADNQTPSADSVTSSSEPSPTASQGEQGDANTSVPTWLLPVAGIVVIAGALVMAIVWLRRLKDSGKE